MTTKQLLLLLLLIVAILPNPATAQFAAGPLGGFNLANVKGSDQDYSSRNGFSGGALIVAPVNRWLSVQPEFYYIQKGANGETTAAQEMAEVQADSSAESLRLNYFEVPLLLRLATGGESARIYVLGGPAIAARLACSIEITQDGGIQRTDECKDVNGSDIVRSVDYSVVGGFGLDIKMDRGRFADGGPITTFDFRMINGWQSLSSDGPSFLQALKNRTFALSVRFPIGNE